MFYKALKVDMVLETMWPDVANKCFGIFWERDEVKKAAMKDGLSKVRKCKARQGKARDAKMSRGRTHYTLHSIHETCSSP